MKQCDIEVGKLYRLVRMKYRDWPNDDGKVVRIIRKKLGRKGWRQSGERYINCCHYWTEGGVKLTATNLEVYVQSMD